jgi:hypothetical protein
MSAPNGRANGSAIDDPIHLPVPTAMPAAAMNPTSARRFSVDQVKELIAELEVPFDPAVIEWRVTNTTKSGKLRGQVIPYADSRAYTDRLNSTIRGRRSSAHKSRIPCSPPPVGHERMPSIPAPISRGR